MYVTVIYTQTKNVDTCYLKLAKHVEYRYVILYLNQKAFIKFSITEFIFYINNN